METVMDWSKYLHNRQIAKDTIGESEVSTQLIAVDFLYSGGCTSTWRTTISVGGFNQEHEDCVGSVDSAMAMHRRTVERLKPLDTRG